MDLSRFSNPALLFSGGKDSLALLYLLRDQLEHLTVYHLDTGDLCPETRAVVAEVRQWIPHFVEVQTDSRKWREANGMPTDLLPTSSEFLGVAYGMSATRMTSRFQCCWANIMKPMHDQLYADGVDCVIRGTKTADTGKVPFEGQGPDYYVMLPIRDWSHEKVFEFLKSVGAPVNPIYENFRATSAPECLTCTAWWDDGKGAYLKSRHPAEHAVYRANLLTIKKSLQSHLADLERELD